MNNLRITSIIIIILINIFLEIIVFLDINLLITNPLKYNFRYDLGIISCILAILVIPILKGNYSKTLHFIWLLPCIYGFLFFTKSPRVLEEMDFLFSKEVKFRAEQHIKDKWLINYIIIENKDTIYYNQNDSWEEFFTKEDLKRLEVRKSFTQNYYHLRLN